MSITKDKYGNVTITGRDDIDLYRTLTLRSGLELEIKGIRLNRGRTCYAIAKQEWGFKGNKQKVLDQLNDVLERYAAWRNGQE